MGNDRSTRGRWEGVLRGSVLGLISRELSIWAQIRLGNNNDDNCTNIITNIYPYFIPASPHACPPP